MHECRYLRWLWCGSVRDTSKFAFNTRKLKQIFKTLFWCRFLHEWRSGVSAQDKRHCCITTSSSVASSGNWRSGALADSCCGSEIPIKPTRSEHHGVCELMATRNNILCTSDSSSIWFTSLRTHWWGRDAASTTVPAPHNLAFYFFFKTDHFPLHFTLRLFIQPFFWQMYHFLFAFGLAGVPLEQYGGVEWQQINRHYHCTACWRLPQQDDRARFTAPQHPSVARPCSAIRAK